MNDRFTLLPDQQFAALRERLRERVSAAARVLDANTFADVFDPVMRGVLDDALTSVEAHEGTVWLADANQEYLVPAYNTGAHAAQLVNVFRHPLDRGHISMVFRNSQSFCENDVYRHPEQDRTLDQSLHVLTCAMIAVPWYFAHAIRGVISCVQLKPADDSAPDPSGFSVDALHRVERSAAVLTRLMEHYLVATTVAWRT
jgi:hypothetical protein